MMDELLDQFLIEGGELVQQASDDLLLLEKQPGDPALLDSCFRAVHTLKGSAGLFDYGPLERLLHAAEDFLGELRSGRLLTDRSVVDLLLVVVAQVERWLSDIGAVQVLPDDAAATAAQLSETLRARLSAESPTRSPTRRLRRMRAGPRPCSPRRLFGELPAHAPLVAVRYVPDPDCYFRGDDPLALVRSIPGLLALSVDLRSSPRPTTRNHSTAIWFSRSSRRLPWAGQDHLPVRRRPSRDPAGHAPDRSADGSTRYAGIGASRPHCPRCRPSTCSPTPSTTSSWRRHSLPNSRSWPGRLLIAPSQRRSAADRPWSTGWSPASTVR